MPYDEVLVNRVKTVLGGGRRVEAKKMFAGLTFMVRGKMCVSVGKDRIMCRIDPAIHDAALGRPGCRTVVMKGRPYRGFVHVDAEAVKSNGDLAYWVGLALDFNQRAKASAKVRNRKNR